MSSRAASEKLKNEKAEKIMRSTAATASSLTLAGVLLDEYLPCIIIIPYDATKYFLEII